MPSNNTKMIKTLGFNVAILWIIVMGQTVGPRLKEVFWGKEPKTTWLDEKYTCWDKSGDRRCEISIPDGGSTRLVLLTELGEPLVELLHDTEAGGGKIRIYNRQGEIVWEAP